ncbi:MAG: DUF4221 domain-containing protein [Bacteroidia bacterium]|jgi:hypothetical protein|nr:DUF4221 domain-containing protein [Bacteroidia bacterium]
MFTALISCSEHVALEVKPSSAAVMTASPGIVLKAWDVCRYNGKELIYALHRDSLQVLFFEVKGGKPLYSVSLQQLDSLSPSNRDFGICARSPDSVFVHIPETRTIFLLNGSGNIARKYHTDVAVQGITDYCFVVVAGAKLLCDGQNLYAAATRLDIVLRTPETRKEYYAVYPELRIPLNGNAAQVLNGKWPETYRQGLNTRDYYPQRVLLPNGKHYVGFAASDFVFERSFDNKITELRTPASSLNSVHNYPDEKLGHFDYLEEYDITESRFSGFIFDANRNYCYRIVHHGTSYRNADSVTVNSYFDKPWSVAVFDENLKPINEITFDPKLYLPGIIPVKEGWLVRKRKHKDVLTADETEFVLFQLTAGT